MKSEPPTLAQFECFLFKLSWQAEMPTVEVNILELVQSTSTDGLFYCYSIFRHS